MKPMHWKAHGKWILAGEHAVLRGSPALVFPIYARRMSCRYQPSDQPLKIDFTGPEGEPLRLLIWGVLENALERVGRNRSDLVGQLAIDSNLPMGAGLGASAALCVAVGRLWECMGWISHDEVYDFSRSLEDVFHGESSGVDIAASLSDVGLRFLRGGERVPLKLNWQPQLYLSYAGGRGVTSECVAKVKNLLLRSPELAEKIDQQMREAVELAEKALESEESEGLMMLAEAIDLAKDCFHRWGLTEGDLSHHMQTLEEAGALSVKPTGSGSGGYVLSLWRKPPPEHLLKSLLNLFPPANGR